MTEMKVRSVAPWFGGKRTMASLIVSEFGQHNQYFEPFCGSLAALFEKKPAKQETAIDLHYDVINLSRVLQNEFTAVELYRQLQFVLVDEHTLSDSQDFLKLDATTQDDVERARHYFIACWMGRNGVAGINKRDFQMAVRWTAGGGSPSVRWESARESIPAFHRRLQGVVLLHRNAFRCIPRIHDHKKTVIYVDPPYHWQSRSSGKYLHDFPKVGGGQLFRTVADPHDLLRDQLAAFKQSRIVVSYYDCDAVRELYKGWTFVEVTRNKNLHSQNKRGAGRAEAPEVLIINGPSYA